MSKLVEYRCQFCGKLLFKACLPPATHIEIMCQRNSCKRMNVFTVPNHLTVNGKNGSIKTQLHENLERLDR